MNSFQSTNPTLFNGQAMVIIRSGYEKSVLGLLAASEGIKNAGIKISFN